ncbi:MAG TPA: hypothetical protein VIY48_06035, partial [Candidatus Paceibacterota bacterium]
MKTPKSKIYRMALYVHHVLGKEVFTAADLLAAGNDAAIWYNDHMDPSIIVKKEEILRKYGYTHIAWVDVLATAGHFYFYPTINENACNTELRALFADVMHVNNPPYQMNL